MIRTYSELIKLPTFEERFKYLQLNGRVGAETFGYDRYLNQLFYQSDEWKSIRAEIIIRDNGCDLGIEGRDIRELYVNGKKVPARIYIHHMNPLLLKDITDRTEFLTNPDYLITTSFRTHQAIHYGDEDLLIKDPIVRTKNDTCPWKIGH